VDDDSAFCKSLGDILRIRRYSVFETSNPDELIDMTKDGVCGVVLLDMKLDGADGLGVLQQIREYDLQLPVILVTGYREEMTSSIEAALKLNAYACLYKPLQIEELIQVLIGIQHQMLGKILGRDPDK
jgi:DNA-binding NtrC family response regulator